MSESLRERVLAAVTRYVDGDIDAGAVRGIVDVVFDVMAGARPCVTCGKSIGPAKVARGYVQCYDCTHSGRTPESPA